MEKYSVTVIRRPSKTLVMVRMQETVAKAQFYLGEMLACEALVEIEGKKGFALMAGDDTQKVSLRRCFRRGMQNGSAGKSAHHSGA